MKKYGKNILLVSLSIFGLLSLFLTTSILFDLFGIRELEGNYVPFIVWANFLCAILYLAAVYGLLKNQNWVVKPLLISVGILIVAQIGLFIHIVGDGLYETKTVGAMIFRIAITIVFALMAFQLKQKNSETIQKNTIA